MKPMYFNAGDIENNSPIGTLHLDRRAKAAELLWLSRAIEASGLDINEIISVEGYGDVAFVERAMMTVVIPRA